jgi:predicted NBD/HSP70 family sugar kinase
VPRKLNLTRNIRRNNSTADYIKSVKTLLHKSNEILREPTDDYDVALEISEQLKQELNELEESLNARKTDLTDETPPEEVIERVIELINKFKKPKNTILIAVTVDGAVTRAKAAPAAAPGNANMGELAAMLGTLQPFRTA